MARKDNYDKIQPDRKNANKGTERGRYMVEASLRETGAGRSILLDKDGRIIAGNKTFEAASDIGLPVRVVETDGTELVAVKRTDLDLGDDTGTARKLAYYDNRAAQVGLDWDAEQMLADIGAGLDLSAMFKQDELDELLADLQPKGTEGDTPAEVDRAEELRQKWQTAPGQLWELGAHRLVCGDCTDPATVARVMGGERAACMWTDPPYGVDYTGGTKDALKIENDTAEGLPALLAGFMAVAETALEPGAPFYIAHPAGALCIVFGNAIIAAGWKFHQTLIWKKDRLVLGHSDYHFTHEPIYYGWLPGEGRSGRGNHEGSRWHGDHSQTSVFEIDRPMRNAEHPTMKPPELVEAMLRNSTTSGAIVYEPFSGSGTTIISCENLSRRCRAVEISAAYCAVALERFFQHCGKLPVLISSE